jgi:hypothetical protein
MEFIECWLMFMIGECMHSDKNVLETRRPLPGPSPAGTIYQVVVGNGAQHAWLPAHVCLWDGQIQIAGLGLPGAPTPVVGDAHEHLQGSAPCTGNRGGEALRNTHI